REAALTKRMGNGQGAKAIQGCGPSAGFGYVALVVPKRGGMGMRGGFIWRALDRARAMNLAEAGAPTPESVGGDVSRRRVLTALAGGVGLAALPRWPAFAQQPASVAIVGAGLAGLAALDMLRNH